MFGFFKSKKKNTVTPEEYCLNALSKTISLDNTIKNGKIKLNGLDLEIGIISLSSRDSGDITLVHLAVELISNLFEDDYIPMQTGMGKDIESAIDHAVLNFHLTTICVFEKLFEKEVLDKHRDFDVYTACGMIMSSEKNGEQTHMDLYSYVKGGLKEIIGNKSFYFINIFISKNKDEEIIEVKLNGIIVEALNKYLKPYVDNIDAQEFYTVKTTILLKRNVENKFPYTKKQIEDFTIKTLDTYRNNMDKGHEEICNKVFELTSDPALTQDLVCWIPEIVAYRIIKDVTFSEYIMIMKDNDKIITHKYKFTHFAYVENKLDSLLANGDIDGDFLQNLLARSASGNAIMKALDGGSKLSDLRFSYICAYPVEDDYEVR